jgi:hypothetical protein
MVDSQTPAKRNPSNKGLTCFSILSAARIEPSRFQMGKKNLPAEKRKYQGQQRSKKRIEKKFGCWLVE